MCPQWDRSHLPVSPSVSRKRPCLSSFVLLDAGTDEIGQQQNLRNPGQDSSSFSSYPIAPVHQHQHQVTSNDHSLRPSLLLPTNGVLIIKNILLN